ncbi:uncharacterized protein [Euphorbia lathyris]|uniref:uncharacterized protein n=1 Tax=Euphorbia lathyris TaxID=212925 RepID=UPI003313EEB4
MSGGKRPAPSPILRGRKRFQLPKWIISDLSQLQTPSSTISGVGDATMEDGSSHNSDSLVTSQTTSNVVDQTASHTIIDEASPVASQTTLDAANPPTLQPTVGEVDPTCTLDPPVRATPPPTRVAPLPSWVAPLPVRPTPPPTQATPPPTEATPPPTQAAPPPVRPTCSPASSSAATDSPTSYGDDGSLKIWVEGKILCPQSCVTRKLTDIFKLNTDITGYRLKGVSKETRTFYWREFMKRCHWEEAIDQLVKAAYPRLLSKAYSQFLHGLRKKPRPPFMPEEVYNAWDAYWDSPEGKRRSWLGQLSRHCGVENGPMSCHTGGSLSMLEIRDLLSRELGRHVDPYTLFVYTHTRNHDGVTFVDERSRRINERVSATRERMQQVEGEVVD